MEKIITYKAIDKTYFSLYDQVSMIVNVESEYFIEKINNGLGGIIIKEQPVTPYIKDLGKYEIAAEYEKKFNIVNWHFYMAFDGETPVGATTLVSRTKEINMLDDRDDLCVLWDIRVANGYKYKGIGQKLFDYGREWAKKQGLKQIKIECQNNNVPACKFYHKQGAVLSKIDEYAYHNDDDARHEVQLIWYLDI